MTDKQDLIREIHEYVTTHGGENTATHLLVQAASAIQTQAAELEAVGAGGVSGPLIGRASLQSPGFDAADMATASAQGFRDGVASLSAQAEGWRPIETAPKGELVLLWSEITRGEPFIGDWAEYARYNHPQFTHWSRWDGLPPTSAEGVEHG